MLSVEGCEIFMTHALCSHEGPRPASSKTVPLEGGLSASLCIIPNLEVSKEHPRGILIPGGNHLMLHRYHEVDVYSSDPSSVAPFRVVFVALVRSMQGSEQCPGEDSLCCHVARSL